MIFTVFAPLIEFKDTYNQNRDEFLALNEFAYKHEDEYMLSQVNEEEETVHFLGGQPTDDLKTPVTFYFVNVLNHLLDESLAKCVTQLREALKNATPHTLVMLKKELDEVVHLISQEKWTDKYPNLINVIKTLYDHFPQSTSKETSRNETAGNKTIKLKPEFLNDKTAFNDFYSVLVNNGFIDSKQSKTVFTRVFQKGNVSEKINWIGSPVELSSFIALLNSKKCIENESEWLVCAANSFTVMGNSLTREQLKTETKDQNKKALLEKAINHIAPTSRK